MEMAGDRPSMESLSGLPICSRNWRTTGRIGDVVGDAVIGRGADDGQAERDVDRFFKVDELDRDEALIVIERDDGIEAAVEVIAEGRVGDVRAADGDGGG